MKQNSLKLPFFYFTFFGLIFCCCCCWLVTVFAFDLSIDDFIVLLSALLICLLVSCVDCDFFISVDFALLVIVLAGIDFLSIFGNGGNLDAIDPVDCDCLLIDCLVCWCRIPSFDDDDDDDVESFTESSAPVLVFVDDDDENFPRKSS